jgi:hypothetical protein
VKREVGLLRLENVGCLETPVGECADRRSDSPFGVLVELVHRGDDELPSAACAEVVEPERSQPVRRELGTQVAAPFVRVSHPLGESIERGRSEPRRRDHDAFLVQAPGA